MGHRWPREPLLVICEGLCDVDSTINIYLLNRKEQLLEWPEGLHSLRPTRTGAPEKRGAPSFLFAMETGTQVFLRISLRHWWPKVLQSSCSFPTQQAACGCHRAEKGFGESCLSSAWLTSIFLGGFRLDATCLASVQMPIWFGSCRCSLTITRVKAVNHYSWGWNLTFLLIPVFANFPLSTERFLPNSHFQTCSLQWWFYCKVSEDYLNYLPMQHALAVFVTAELRWFNKQLRLKTLTSGSFLISFDLLNIEPNVEKN